ncbi:MAG TPA: class I SAM-dependent methyltransferase [Saprospiraceae bacterium]|nr:class I SAM-dependent methyltransferase [Saprospiraceae bacterium]
MGKTVQDSLFSGRGLEKTMPMISKWMLKAFVQKLISFFPQREKVNYLFQKYVTRGVELTDTYFDFKLTHARDHLGYFRKYGQQPLSEATILELGLGWYPIVPIALYLSGAHRIISIDIQDWMTHQSQLTTIRKFQEWRAQGKLMDYLPDIDEQRWAAMMSLTQKNTVSDLNEISQTIRLEPLIKDARATEFADNSMDYICSNNTFEHIPEAILADILREFKRILKSGGVMSHFIDLSDHFAHFDPQINIYHFLRFNEKQWQRIDNRIQPQNRLRWPDYLALYAALDLPVSDQTTRPGDLTLLAQVPLAEQYRSYRPEALAISHGYLVSVA